MNPEKTRFPWRTLFAVALGLIALVTALFWFGPDYAAEIRKAAYAGDAATVRRILQDHPKVIDSHITHPEMLVVPGCLLLGYSPLARLDS